MEPSARPAISRQTIRTNLLAATVAMLLAVVAMVGLQFVSMRHSLLEQLDVQAQIVAGAVAPALLFQDVRAANDVLSTLHGIPNIRQAELLRLDGSLFAEFHADDFVAAAEDRIARVSIERPVSASGQEAGSLRIIATMRSLYTSMAIYAAMTLLIAAGALALTLPLFHRMRRRIAASEAHLDFLAHSDPVTGLSNRHAFNARLDAAMPGPISDAVALVLIDLDNFKVVNDTLGHHAGDELLAEIGRVLRVAAPQADMVCRMGGDEYAILLTGPSAHEVGAIAERVLTQLRQPVTLAGQEIYPSASIGTSIGPRDAADAAALIGNADIAMYRAKQLGKNSAAAFHPDMTEYSRRRLQLQSDLHRALDFDELYVEFQPLVSLDDRRIVSVEALLRWQHPQLGPISPAEFIPIAEDSGLIVPIGARVLLLACTEVARLHARGHSGLSVAVNVSARQLRREDFIAELREVLHRTGLPAERLELEITESLLMESLDASIDNLHQIRRLGVGLSVDDFGTGYSSLSYISNLPLHTLKIDRSFVSRIPGDGEPITAAIIALARSFGLRVVAEGVEDEVQLDYLERAGCDLVQGWLFSGAVSPRRLEQMLDTAIEPAALEAMH